MYNGRKNKNSKINEIQKKNKKKYIMASSTSHVNILKNGLL